jgi:hypothetical protein
MPVGETNWPTFTGAPGLFVAVAMGVTVPDSELAT